MSASTLNLAAKAPTAGQVAIDFLYLDLETCDRCRDTGANLETALADAGRLLEAAGAQVAVRKTLVASEEQARALGFVSSPTLRVNGRDIALELRESRCEAEACACNGGIDCRVWVWQGQEHTAAPPAMIVDAILREVYGAAAPAQPAIVPAGEVPENLQRFFTAMATAEPSAAAASCCSPREQAACCAPEAKASCCGQERAGGCGCQ
jgi:hypothetical protein